MLGEDAAGRRLDGPHARKMSRDYYRDMLRDLKQREAALDSLFEVYGDVIMDATEVRRCLYGGLAGAAVSAASQPFCHGDLQKFDELLDFAVALDPNVRRSFGWRMQMIERRIGPRMWSVTLPARNLIHLLSQTPGVSPLASVAWRGNEKIDRTRGDSKKNWE
jgi:hypothetical protein